MSILDEDSQNNIEAEIANDGVSGLLERIASICQDNAEADAFPPDYAQGSSPGEWGKAAKLIRDLVKKINC